MRMSPDASLTQALNTKLSIFSKPATSIELMDKWIDSDTFLPGSQSLQAVGLQTHFPGGFNAWQWSGAVKIITEIVNIPSAWPRDSYDGCQVKRHLPRRMTCLLFFQLLLLQDLLQAGQGAWIIWLSSYLVVVSRWRSYRECCPRRTFCTFWRAERLDICATIPTASLILHLVEH